LPAGVLAILGQARFEYLHPLEQLPDLRPQRRILGTQGLKVGVPEVQIGGCRGVL
jgi:hypothetical protein